MKYLFFIAGLVAVAAPLPSWSQAEKVFRGNNLNSSELVDALAPEAPSLTRSFRVIPNGRSATPKPKSVSASILITFMTNSDELTPDAKKNLDTLGAALKSDRLAAFKFAIEGHADPRGGDEFNMKLSERRAKSVVAYLTDAQGIEPHRFQAIGKGQTELLNKADVYAPENRRVTVRTLIE